MAPRSSHINTTPPAPLHLPIVPTTTTTTTTSSSHTLHGNKRPREIRDNDDCLDNGQRPAPYDRGFSIPTQLQHCQGEAWPQQQQQQQQGFGQDSSFLDGVDFLSFPSSFSTAQEQPQQIYSPPAVNYQELVQQQQQLQQLQLTPVTPTQTQTLDFNSSFFYEPFPPTPGISPPQLALDDSTPDVFLSPPSMSSAPLPPPQQPPQQQPAPAVRQSIYTNKYCPRPPTTMTTTTTTAAAAAAFSKSASSSTSLRSFPSSSASSSSSYPLLPPHSSMLRIGGYTLEEAGIKLPASLSDEERRRRTHLLARELHYEALHPPILPPSQVPDLPEKPPPVALPKLHAGMAPREREETETRIRTLSAAQKKSDQERNNMAAKKSRALRIECLDNTRLQLNAKAAECAWLRLQLVALVGEPMARLPSEAWGGFDYVYRGANKKKKKRKAEGGEAMDVVGQGGAEEGDNGEKDVEEEEEEEEEEDMDGSVPCRVKDAITEEIRARVEAHKDRLEEEQKKKTSTSRMNRATAKAAAASAVQGDANETSKRKPSPAAKRQSSTGGSSSGGKE